MFFDSHAHLDDEKFEADRNEIIDNLYESGVKLVLNAASDMQSSEAGIELGNKYDFIYSSVGVHPHSVGTMTENDLEKLRILSQNKKVVAIGEIGLDYYYDFSPREDQKYWFSRQLNLAKELKLPVIVHDRDAHEDTLNIIVSEKAKEVGGVFHCFAGSVEMAKQVLENNFYISFGGVLTFKNAKKAIEVVKYVPLDRLLIETDSPYLTPEPHRGKRNDPSYVRLVAEKMAEIKGLSVEVVAKATADNAKQLFNIL